MGRDRSLDVLDTFDKFWDDEAKYLKYKTNNPTFSLGDILQNTGIALKGLAYMYERAKTANLSRKDIVYWIDKIVSGLETNEIVRGLIPRTVCFSTTEPIESESGRWESFIGGRLEKQWARTDVSKSQFYAICFGLDAISRLDTPNKYKVKISRVVARAEDLLSRCLNRIVENNWNVCNKGDTPTKDGRFRTWKYFPLASNAIRMLALSKMCERLGIDPKLTKFDKKMIKLNMKIMGKHHLWQDADANHQTLLGYWSLFEGGSYYMYDWYYKLRDASRVNALFHSVCDYSHSYGSYLESIIEKFNINSGLKYIWKTDFANNKPIREPAPKGQEILRTDLLLLNEIYIRQSAGNGL